ncbi:MAG: glycosyltransferase [Saprospiraceae bacterium]|nr:glycosyltransferase [Saprospiraceae bacterium]
MALKQHFIILHGTDCNIIPEIKYGNLGKPVLRWFTGESIKKATILLPVSISLIENDSDYYTKNGILLGLNKSLPNFKTPYKVINNGLDYNEFYITEEKRNPNTFLTVAFGLENGKNLKLKGIDLILNFAKDNPEYEITILGSNSIFKYEHNLKNVTLVGKVNHGEMIKYYNNHKYYLQLSISESFGLSLCEAMLCGCIPIVSNVGIMPTIIDKYGYVLQKRNPVELNKLIQSLIYENNHSIGMIGAEHIKTKYDIKLREKALLDLLSHHLNHTKSP